MLTPSSLAVKVPEQKVDCLFRRQSIGMCYATLGQNVGVADETISNIIGVADETLANFVESGQPLPIMLSEGLKIEVVACGR